MANRKGIEPSWRYKESLRKEDEQWEGLNTCDGQLTSETPFARSALICSSLSSGQAMGEVEARVMRQMMRVVRRGRYMSKVSVQQAKDEV